MSPYTNDALTMMSAYNSMPMSPYESAYYGLAQGNQALQGQALQGNLDYNNRALDVNSQQFQDMLALQRQQELWNQMMGEKGFTASEAQRLWENNFKKNEAMAGRKQQMDLLNRQLKPAETAAMFDRRNYFDRMKAANSVRNLAEQFGGDQFGGGIIPSSQLPSWYDLLSQEGVGTSSPFTSSSYRR